MARTHTWVLLLCTCLVLACGGDSGGPSGSTGTISGTVTSGASGAAVAGATVSVGAVQATSDAGGQFELNGVPTGSGTIACSKAGFLAYSAAIAVQEGSNAHDIALATQEVYELTNFALFVPASAGQVRAVMVALGGPDTRAFVDGRRSAVVGNPPETEAGLQALGLQLRTLARDSGFAVMGSGQLGWPNEGSYDAEILGALTAGAAASGHPELSSAPLIMLGLSGGGPEASGMTQRQADRIAAFALYYPSSPSSFLSAAAQRVPGYIALAELDAVVDNPLTTQVFLSNRAAGAIWGLSVEPSRGHTDVSVEGRTTLVNWVTVAAGLRLPASPGGALRSVAESSGWLGNRATGEIAPIGTYAGDPLVASWLPTAATAAEWSALVNP